MSSLALPKPQNMRGRYNRHVDGDVYNIAERIAEIDPSLYIDPIEPPITLGDQTWNFAITEKCADGVERLVFRTECLDARILEHVQYLLHVPFEKRFDEAERREAKLQAEAKENELNELYERIGGPMRVDLERCGFADRNSSYPKRRRRR